jgi:DNA-binding transcriptional ArsR family regulator
MLVVRLFKVTETAADLDGALRALADGNRRRILAVVRDQPGAVGEIAERVAMSQQAVRTDGLGVVREFLDGFWPSHLAALKRVAEAEFRRGGARDGRDG